MHVWHTVPAHACHAPGQAWFVNAQHMGCQFEDVWTHVELDVSVQHIVPRVAQHILAHPKWHVKCNMRAFPTHMPTSMRGLWCRMCITPLSYN